MSLKLAVILLAGAALAGTATESSAYWVGRRAGGSWGPFGGWGMSGVGLYGQGFDRGYYPYYEGYSYIYPSCATDYRYGDCR